MKTLNGSGIEEVISAGIPVESYDQLEELADKIFELLGGERDPAISHLAKITILFLGGMYIYQDAPQIKSYFLDDLRGCVFRLAFEYQQLHQAEHAIRENIIRILREHSGGLSGAEPG